MGLAIVLGIYLWLIACINPTAYTEYDCDGYLLLAKRMARLQPLAQTETDPFYLQGHLWVTTTSGKVIPKFAPGYPLVLAIFYRLGGDEGMLWASPVMGGLAILGMFLLCRQWMRPMTALLATAALAINPALLFYSSYFLTHATMVAVVVWGMCFLWSFARRPGVASGIGAGLLLGFSGCVRHTGLLLGPALLLGALAGVLNVRRRPGAAGAGWRIPWRPLIALGAAYAVPVGALFFYNWIFFGGPLTTGYALTGEQDAFAWHRLGANLPAVYDGLNTVVTVFLLPVALMGLLAVGPWTRVLMRLAWFVPLVMIYGAYYWLPHSLGGFRFFLDIVPLLIASAFLVVDRAGRRLPLRWLAAAVMLGMVVWLDAPRLTKIIQGQTLADARPTLQAARMAAATLSPNAVVFAQDPRAHYVGTRADFRLYDLNAFNRRWGLRMFSGQDWLGRVRAQPARQERDLGIYENTTQAGLFQDWRDLILKYQAQGRQVALLIPAWAMAQRQRELGPGWSLQPLKQWPDPVGRTWAIYGIRPPATQPAR